MPEKKPLSEKQCKFLRSKSRLVIYRGGIRSGKTWVLCLKAIEYSLNKRRFCIVSFSYPMLRDVCIHTMKQILDAFGFPYTENVSEKTITIKGQEILFRSGDSPDSLRGLSLDGFGIDEGREFKTRDIYDIMIGRLSNSKDAQGYITSSPKGRNWVNDLEGQPNTEIIIQRTEDNPFLPPEYIESLRSQYTNDFARQELDADIVEFGSGIISSLWFNRIEHRRPLQGVRAWDVAVSIKTSADYSAGVLCSFDTKFVIHDIVHGKMQYPDLRKKIVECAKSDGPDVTIAIEQAGQQQGFINDLQQLPELRGYVIRAIKPRGDKLNRAMRWASRAQAGMVDVCQGVWNQAFYNECNSFTGDDSHEHDDMIDAVSLAYTSFAEGKRVWESFSYQKSVVKMVIDWSKPSEYNKLWIACWQNRHGEIAIIACIWDQITGKLYVYWSKMYAEPIADIISKELIRECRISRIASQMLGNDSIVNEGRSTSKLLQEAFKRSAVPIGSLRLPVMYEEAGAIMYGNSLFRGDAVVISDECKEVAAQMVGWTYEDNGKPAPEYGFEYAKALTLIMSELKKVTEQAAAPKKRREYMPRMEEQNKQEKLGTSWQVA